MSNCPSSRRKKVSDQANVSSSPKNALLRPFVLQPKSPLTEDSERRKSQATLLDSHLVQNLDSCSPSIRAKSVASLIQKLPVVSRAVYKDGGKNAVPIPAEAKKVAKWVTTRASILPGGRAHIVNIQNRGFSGFKIGKEEYAGGKIFNNFPMPDSHRLPMNNGQTYREWDIRPCEPGKNRGTERIVTGSDGKFYYTNNHYGDFTEFSC